MSMVGSKSAFRPTLGVQGLREILAIDVFPVPRGPAKGLACRTWVVLDRVPQRPHDGLLPDHLGEVEQR